MSRVQNPGVKRKTGRTRKYHWARLKTRAKKGTLDNNRDRPQDP